MNEYNLLEKSGSKVDNFLNHGLYWNNGAKIPPLPLFAV